MKKHYPLKTVLLFCLILSNLHCTAQCWQTVGAAGRRTLAINGDGTLWAWGRNNLGSLGDGTNFHRYVPYQISTQTNWDTIAVSQNDFSFGIRSNGTLWGWGNNAQGYLGNGTTVQSNVPIQIGTSLWKNITCGMSTAIGIKLDGSLWGWGYNYHGELGTGNTNPTLSPVLISSLNWKTVAIGFTSTYAIREDGTLWSWGDNTYGQLGYGNLNASYTPVQVGTATDWDKVFCGNYYTMAIKNDGTLWAWGDNFAGCLGDGTYVDKLAPVQVGTGLWETVALGEQASSVGVMQDGTIWGWGYNGYGQLAEVSSHSNVPLQIGTGSNWTTATLGFGHSVFINSDGAIYACGHNLYGQVGDNTNVDKNVLTNVACPALGIGDVAAKPRLGLYPNPFEDHLYFDTQEIVLNIEVYDISGRMLYANPVENNTADLGFLGSGTYLIKVTTNEQAITMKVIKS